MRLTPASKSTTPHRHHCPPDSAFHHRYLGVGTQSRTLLVGLFAVFELGMLKLSSVLIDALAEALVDVWGRLGLPLRHHALAAE